MNTNLKPKINIPVQSKPIPTLAPRILVPTIHKEEEYEEEYEEEQDESEEEEEEEEEGEEESEEESEEEESEEGEEQSEEGVVEATTTEDALTGTKPKKKKAPRKPRTKKVYLPSETMFTQLLKQISDLRDLSRKVINLTRETHKSANRELRELRNQMKKQKGEKTKRKPRGFARPALISNEMVDYLLNTAQIKQVDRKVEGKVVGQVTIEVGCSLARNELTSALCRHFEDSGMRKCEADHRKIYFDEETAKLFKIDIDQFRLKGGAISEDGEPIITYFELSKYLGQHCGKKAVGH